MLLRLAMAWFWLLAWLRVAPHGGCGVLLAVMTPAVGAVALNMLEPAVLRRHAFVRQYLRPDKALAWWLSRRLLLILWQIIKAVGLVVVLLVAALQWPGWMLALLAGDVLVAFGLYSALLAVMDRQARPWVAPMLARRVLVWVNALLLLGAVVAVELVTPHPDYRLLDWNATLDEAMGPVTVGCRLLAPLARTVAGQEAIAWRLMQMGVEGLGDSLAALLAWVLFLAASTLAVWAWSRLLAGVLVDGGGVRIMAGRSDDD